jgi:hypothetical protein
VQTGAEAWSRVVNCLFVVLLENNVRHLIQYWLIHPEDTGSATRREKRHVAE